MRSPVDASLRTAARDARLGASAVHYSFTVRDLHPLLLTGLPAHLQQNPSPKLKYRLFSISPLVRADPSMSNTNMAILGSSMERPRGSVKVVALPRNHIRLITSASQTHHPAHHRSSASVRTCL